VFLALHVWRELLDVADERPDVAAWLVRQADSST